MIYPKLSDGTIDWCAMCKHRGSDIFDLCCMCNYIKDDDPPSRYEPIVKPMTNGELIRRMTDEELAKLFEMIPHSGNPSTYTIDGFCVDDGLRTKRQWLDWLQKENSE